MVQPFEPAPSPLARRVATYERVSTETQSERETIKTQTDALDAWIAREPGITVIARYSDDGVSGRKELRNRPGGARLLEDAEARRFDELWVYRTDRLGRNLADMALTANRLGELGITIWSASQGRLDRFQFKLMALLAEDEADRLRERFADGTDRAAREGRFTGGVRTYGYRIEGQKPRCYPVPDERVVSGDWTAAGVVRHIYRRVALDHWSCRLVAGELNDLGIPTLYAREDRAMRKRRVTGRWGEGRIRNMLVNPTYNGTLTFGKRSKRVRELITAPVEPLVSDDLWQAAQEVLASHRIAAKNTERVYLLRGVMTCAHCEQRLVGSTNRDTTYYRCGGKRRARGALGGRCFGRDVKGDAIEAMVWADIERWLRDPGDLLDELDGRSERQEAEERRQAERAVITTALARLEDDMARLVSLAINGSLTEPELRTHRARIADEEAVLRTRLDALEPTGEPAAISEDLLSQLRSRLDAGLTDTERQEIVSLLVPGIGITTTILPSGLKHTTARISYRFPVAVVSTRTRRGSWPR